jgi:hypothetical protein
LAGLGHGKGEFAHAREHGLGLEAVGMVAPVGRAFMRLGAKRLVAFDLGRFVDQNPPRLAGAVQA